MDPRVWVEWSWEDWVSLVVLAFVLGCLAGWMVFGESIVEEEKEKKKLRRWEGVWRRRRDRKGSGGVSMQSLLLLEPQAPWRARTQKEPEEEEEEEEEEKKDTVKGLKTEGLESWVTVDGKSSEDMETEEEPQQQQQPSPPSHPKMDWHALSFLIQRMAGFWIQKCSPEWGDECLVDIGDKTPCDRELQGTVHEKEVWMAWYAHDIGPHSPSGQTQPSRDHHQMLLDWFRAYDCQVEKNRRSYVALLSVPVSPLPGVHSFQDLTEEEEDNDDDDDDDDDDDEDDFD
jgi:hypothetical protein